MYYEYDPTQLSVESIKADMIALPVNKAMSDKYYVGYFDNERLVAVLDLMADCPKKKIAFIGFFIMDKSEQESGKHKTSLD